MSLAQRFLTEGNEGNEGGIRLEAARRCVEARCVCTGAFAPGYGFRFALEINLVPYSN